MKYLISFFFLIAINFSVIGQEVKYDSLFKVRAYDKIFTALSTKEKADQLSLDEIYWLAKAYGRKGQYTNGLLYAKKIERLSLAKKDTIHLLEAYNLIAENLIDLNKIKEGITFCEKVAPVFRIQDSISFQKFCFKWGMFYKVNEEYDKALSVYNNITDEKFRKLGLFKNNYATILENLGKNNEALIFYKNDLANKKKKKEDLVITYNNIGLSLYKLHKENEAKIYLDSAESAITKKTPLRSQKIIYKTLYEYYINTENPFNASIALDYVNSVNEAIFNQRLNEKIQVLENAHENEIKLNKQLVKSQKRQFIVLLASILIIFSLVFFLFSLRFKNIKTAHEKIVIEQKLLRSQMTPHFIFNSLSVLQGMILNKETKKATSYLAKFSRLLRLVLENSREKFVPISEELEAIKNYIDLQNMRKEQQITFLLSKDVFLTKTDIHIPPMLIQPFVENAILHGFTREIENPTININLSFNKNILSCIIIDNGVGVNTVKKEARSKKESLSTKITIERLKILSKELKVTTGLTIKDQKEFNKNGTIVTLLMPYKL